MYDLVIKGGRIVDYASATDGVLDLALENGSVVAIGEDVDGRARSVIDATGCYVMPGLVDLHVHLDRGYGGAAGHSMLARAGVTTALDLGATSPAEVWDLAAARGAGLTIGTVARLAPGVHVSADPGRSEIRRALDRLLAEGALGVKIHVDSGWTVDTAGLIAEVAHELGVWLAIHCGTRSSGSNLDGLREAIGYLDGRPAQIAHVNSYCRGELEAPEVEAAEAVKLLRAAPAVTAESYLSEMNGNRATCAGGMPVVARVSSWLEEAGFAGTEAGLRAAIKGGWAHIPVLDNADITLVTGDEGVAAWESSGTDTGLCLPLNPAQSRVPLAGSKDDLGRFDVTAIATDGGGIPRNVTVTRGLALVELGALTPLELVKKASWSPARLLGLPAKGSLTVGSDADVCVVDARSRTVRTTVAGGRLVFHRGALVPGPTTPLVTDRASAVTSAVTVDPRSSGLYTGAGR